MPPERHHREDGAMYLEQLTVGATDAAYTLMAEPPANGKTCP
jgi:hypothetical protein